MKKLLLLFSALPFLFQCNSPSNDITQWRGNNRDGVFHEYNLLKEWPKDGPELLWSTDELSMGNSSMSIANNSIYLTGSKDSLDEVIALDLEGNIKWRTSYGQTWNESFPESRCTPTFDENKLYVTSGLGDVACLDANTGNILWEIKLAKKFETIFNLWGNAESPLVTIDKVIFSSVGKKTTMIALNKLTGEEIWVSKSIPDSTAYASPILINNGEKNIIVNVTANHVVGINEADGEILWKFNYFNLYNNPTHWQAPIINCVTPLYKNGQLYVTSGYDATGAMFNLLPDNSGIELLWTDTVLDNHHGGVVSVDGKIYGSNWLNNRQGNWCCIDWKTGEKLYETEWETKGAIIYADGMLYCYDEAKGNLALVETSPKEFKIISSFKIPLGTGPHWSHPVINNGVLYVRHGKALMAYDIK